MKRTRRSPIKRTRRTIPKNSSGIYKLESIINGKIYVGCASTFESRKFDHFKRLKNKNHGNYLLQRHYNKHGIDSLVFKVIEIVPKIQEELITDFKNRLLEREQYYMDTLHPYFNICPIAHSPLGVVRSEEFKQKHRGVLNVSKRPEVKEKQSKARLEYWKTHEHPFKERNSFYGKQHTKESCDKIGAKNKVHMKGNNYALGNTYSHTEEELKKMKDCWTPEMKKAASERGKLMIPWNKGLTYEVEKLKGKRNPHSEETKQRMCDAHIGKVFSEEHRHKIGLSKVGKQYKLGMLHTEETKKKISETKQRNFKMKKHEN